MVRRAVALTLALSPLASAERFARLALVVGNNRPAEPAQPTLRYADDDAIRYHERFEGLADWRAVLARIDDDSALYRQVYPSLAPPTRAALLAAAKQLRERAGKLRRQGVFVEVVFVFAGHGGLSRGRPYLALEDGRLTQDDLETLLLRGDPADVTHVIIDACSAASFVEGRGPLRGRREPLADDLLPFGGLAERYGRAGFVLAASADGSAYEWSRFGSGVASHLIRSALSGAADVSPPDGRVTYEELDAFLSRATQDVLPGGYRQEFRVVAPRGLRSAALLDLRPGPKLTELFLDRPGRYFVRDADGHRIADLHHGRGVARLLLPPYSPRFAVVGVSEHGTGCKGPGRWRTDECEREEAAHEFEAAAEPVLLSRLATNQPAVAARGFIEDSVFEQLLSRPFDAGVMKPAEPGHTKRLAPIPVSFGLGYRATIGRVQDELSTVHGLELRFELPVGSQGFFAPVVGVSRGSANPDGGARYPVYQFEVGLEGGLALALGAWRVLGGLEGRYQLHDQVLPSEDRVASVGLGGVVLRAQHALSGHFGFGLGASGGARVASVEGDVRTRPYAAFIASILGALQ